MQDILDRLSERPGALPMSWSRVNTLFRCPLRFDLKYRQRIREPEAADRDATETGILLHKAMELSMLRCCLRGVSLKEAAFSNNMDLVLARASNQAVRDRVNSLREPAEKVLITVLDKAKGRGINAEQRLCLDRTWRPETKRLPWDNTACLGFVDLALLSEEECLIIDYKTGGHSANRVEKTREQLQWYAYLEFLRYPYIQRVHTASAYIEDAVLCEEAHFSRDDLPKIEEWFRVLCERYLKALDGPPEPRRTADCKWCGYAVDCPLNRKGGSSCLSARAEKERTHSPGGGSLVKP